MKIDCERHGRYIIWLARSLGAGWSYVITAAAAPRKAPGAKLDGSDIGRPFRTKTLALRRARARIRQANLQASTPRGGGSFPTPHPIRRRHP